MSIINSLIETQEFATLPPVATKVLKMLEDDDIDVREISHVIEADAPLTLKLLRVANSPLYATRAEITSIPQAILTLGLNRLTNIVLGVSIFSRFLISSNQYSKELMEKFWWHSSCTGIVAKALASKLNRFFRENEFIGGLLHDIGKLAMLQYDSAKYKNVIDIILNEGITEVEAEMAVYETNHLIVGEEISKLWKLPAELTTIIAWHNYPSKVHKHKDLVAIVRFADLLCEVWGADIGEGIVKINYEQEESWLVLCEFFPELKNLDVEIFTFELEEEFKKSSAFLNVLVQGSKS